jgi:hypothetical protein
MDDTDHNQDETPNKRMTQDQSVEQLLNRIEATDSERPGGANNESKLTEKPMDKSVNI